MCYQSCQSSQSSELIELPEVFSSMKKCLFHGALREGGPLLELLELRFVSLSSQSSITSHPAFPDVEEELRLAPIRRQVLVDHTTTVQFT